MDATFDIFPEVTLDGDASPAFDGAPTLALGLTLSGVAGGTQPNFRAIVALSSTAVVGSVGVGSGRLTVLGGAGTLLTGSAGALSRPLPVELTLDARAGVSGGVLEIARLTSSGSAVVGSAGRMLANVASVQATGALSAPSTAGAFFAAEVATLGLTGTLVDLDPAASGARFSASLPGLRAAGSMADLDAPISGARFSAALPAVRSTGALVDLDAPVPGASLTALLPALRATGSMADLDAPVAGARLLAALPAVRVSGSMVDLGAPVAGARLLASLPAVRLDASMADLSAPVSGAALSAALPAVRVSGSMADLHSPQSTATFSAALPGLRVSGALADLNAPVSGAVLSAALPALRATGAAADLDAPIAGARLLAALPPLGAIGAMADLAAEPGGARFSGAVAWIRATGSMADLDAANLRGGSMPVASMQASGVALSGSGAAGAPSVGVVSLVADAVPGQAAVGAFAVPAVRLAGEGYEQTTIGSGTLVLPMLRIGGFGDAPTILPPAEPVTGAAFVMNARTGALTRYENFSFNSFAVFNGETIGATASGLYAIGGETDAGMSIQMVLTTPVSDFGAAQLKRVREAFIGYRTTGRAELHVRADDGEWHVYQMDETRPSGIYRNRVKVGRGVKASYWQFSVRNVDGADLAIDSIAPTVEPLTSRTA